MPDCDYRSDTKSNFLVVSQPLPDPVDHPEHYTQNPSGIECITITRHMNFNLGNAVKYIWRFGLKPNPNSLVDLRKAIWYLQDEIKRLEGEPNAK